MINELKQKAKYMLGPRIFLETEDFCYRSLFNYDARAPV